MLTPQVTAGVKAIYADNTDLVKEGQLVVLLDDSVYRVRYEQTKAALAETVREVVALFQNVQASRANVESSEASLRQATLDFTHRKGLVGSGAISVEEFERYTTTMDVAKAQLEYNTQQHSIAKHRVVDTVVATHPLVQQAIANFRTAYLDLIRCQVFAPATGYVSKRIVQVGDQVKAGDTMLIIVPLYDLWLDANFKETQLKYVRIGQPVVFWTDIYGRSIKYHGIVVGFQAGTGSAFALLPPENAAGNWIKIIQRLPVRISIPPDELEKNPLMIGLSLHVSVDHHDYDSPMLAPHATYVPVYQTMIYDMQDRQLALVEKEIMEIIESNG